MGIHQTDLMHPSALKSFPNAFWFIHSTLLFVLSKSLKLRKPLQILTFSRIGTLEITMIFDVLMTKWCPKF